MKIAQAPHIGFAINDTHDSAWAFMEQGAVEQAQQLGIKLSVISASRRAEQSEVVHQFIRQRVAALIIASLGDIQQDCEAGRSAGIPVITCECGNAEKNAAVYCDVRQDLRAGAELATDYLAKQLSGHGKILHLAAPNSRLRTEGFHAALTRYPDLQIVEGMGDWTPEGSKHAVREALTIHPDIQAIFAHNDRMALGAVAVVVDLDRTGQILVAGVDAMPQAIQAIYEGRMTATIDIMSHITGRVAVATAQRVLGGETVPPFIDTPVKLITPDNLTSAAIEELTMLPQLIRALADTHGAQRQLQEEVIAFQRSLIQELSTPIIPISNNILVMPLIGTLDSTRVQEIMRTMLQAIERSQAKVLILDITGVRMIDTAVANYLLLAAQAAQLLGTHVIMVGIKPEVAQTIVQLGIDLSSIVTQSTLQFGIAYANAHLAKVRICQL